ncbi:MAG: hypothetical protein NY202_04560 [Mollicutes bacterium UO1]
MLVKRENGDNSTDKREQKFKQEGNDNKGAGSKIPRNIIVLEAIAIFLLGLIIIIYKKSQSK